MPEVEHLPIYLVITERVNIWPQSSQYLLKFIRKVIECDLADLQDIYRDVINPMSNAGQQIQVDFYLRQPPEPFKDWKEIELAQLREQEERNKRERIEYLQRTAGDTVTPWNWRNASDEKPGALPGDE